MPFDNAFERGKHGVPHRVRKLEKEGASMTDLRSAIPALIARRHIVGASSPEGRRLSLLIEQIENSVTTAQTIAEIEQIQRDGGRYIHANHGAK